LTLRLANSTHGTAKSTGDIDRTAMARETDDLHAFGFPPPARRRIPPG
jgi:hypothetical protein